MSVPNARRSTSGAFQSPETLSSVSTCTCTPRSCALASASAAGTNENEWATIRIVAPGGVCRIRSIRCTKVVFCSSWALGRASRTPARTRKGSSRYP